MDLHYSDMQGFLPFPLWCIHSPFLEASTLLCVYFIFSPFLQILLSWFSLHFLSQSHFLPICVFVALSSIYFPWFTDTFPFCLLRPLLSKSTFFPKLSYPCTNKKYTYGLQDQGRLSGKIYEHSKDRVVHPLAYSSEFQWGAIKWPSWTTSLPTLFVFNSNRLFFCERT